MSIATSKNESAIPANLPTIVTVIEAGPMERQVCILAESLRRWGGRLSTTPLIAIKARHGPPIGRKTRRLLERFGVHYRRIYRDDRFMWFDWLNKTSAVRYVADNYPGVVIWLDCDILILSEPTELLFDLSPNDPNSLQFAACASDKNIGSARDNDEFAPYFRSACDALGIDFSSLPFVLTEKERIPVRAYWNAGVYAFSADSGLAHLHHEFTLTLLRKGIGSREARLLMSDQVALSLAVHALKLTRKNLPLRYNFHIQPDNPDFRLTAADRDVKLLHYHGCLWRPYFEKTCAALKLNYADTAEFLRGDGPLTMRNNSILTRFHRKLLTLSRKRQERRAVTNATLY
jgi:hypothetical protein